MPMNSTNKFIYYKELENFDSYKFLNECLIKLESKFSPALTFGDKLNPIRNCDSVSIFQEPELDKEVFNIFSFHIKEYVKIFPEVFIETDEGYTLLRYKDGNFYGKHTDDFRSHHRIVSGLLYLNDDYEGGELYFNDLDELIKPKAGSIVLFPSNFAFAHESKPIIKGTKYAIVTWFV